MLPQTVHKRLLKPLISPEQYDFWAQELGSIAAWERCFARVVRRKDEASDTISLTLKPNGNFPGYQAGQHLNLSATIEGRRLTRSYSVTRSPDTSGLISLTIRRDAQGLMSNWLHANAVPGAVLELGAVFGEMTLDCTGCNSQDELILLAAGSGITPMLSLIQERAARAHTGATTLLYWERASDYFCFNRELAELASANPNLNIRRIKTRATAQSGEVAGRISDDQLDALLGAAAKTPPAAPRKISLICGSAGFVETARSLMVERSDKCYSEAFTPPRQVAGDEREIMVSVKLVKSERTLSVSSKRSLLDSLEENGVPVESGCRMGICNTCVCSSVNGATRDISTGLIQRDSPTKLCVSRPMGDLQLEL